MLIRTAVASLLNRKLSVLLCLLSITLSLSVLQTVEQVSTAARAGFSRAVSGTDLIVGPRTGPVNLLLYAVFHLGAANSNMNWDSYRRLAQDPATDWAVPISLGDSHKGYSVLATLPRYFDVAGPAPAGRLVFAQGQAFAEGFGVVLGADVARHLGYQLNDQLVLAHGSSEHSFVRHHQGHPFTVSGILAPTGTPVDRTVHISLQAMGLIHGGETGQGHAGHVHGRGEEEQGADHPHQITAVLMGLHSPVDALGMQYRINSDNHDPLLAIMPAVALSELWQVTGSVEQILQLVAWLVLGISLLGMVSMLLASMRERRQELNVLRVMGARPGFLFLLLECEVLLIALGAMLLSLLLSGLLLWLLRDVLVAGYGIVVSPLPGMELLLKGAGLVTGLALLTGVIPAVSAYRGSRGPVL